MTSEGCVYQVPVLLGSACGGAGRRLEIFSPSLTPEVSLTAAVDPLWLQFPLDGWCSVPRP